MKFTFDYLGAMDSAEIELAPLTIICGENNTGKTYVSYATYALLESWRGLLAWNVPGNILKELLFEGIVNIDLDEVIVSEWGKIKEKTSRKWKHFLPNALAAPEHRFQQTELSFDFNFDNQWIERIFETERLSEQGKVIFKAKKISGSVKLEIVALRDPNDLPWSEFTIQDFVREVILDAVLGIYMPNVFMASAERTGAAIFKDELNLTKNKIVNLLALLDKDKNQNISPTALFETVYKQGYALPVNHNVRFVNRLSSHLGLEVQTFDEAINEMNRLQEALYYAPQDTDRG